MGRHSRIYGTLGNAELAARHLILASDLVQHYKPDREMYMSAPFYLDLKPEEVMMCAAHAPDLQSARSFGLRTAFIYRPNEYGGGPVGLPDKAKPEAGRWGKAMRF